MDRRTFLKTLASLGAAVVLPPNLSLASREEVDQAWLAARQAWGLFEVSEYGTLSYANFEEPRTRREAGDYFDATEFDVGEVERFGSLNERIKDLYRNALTWEATGDELLQDIDFDAIEERVEDSWDEWFSRAQGQDRKAIDAAIETWLDEAPDWCDEWEDFYRSGTAQGAAYRHFLGEDPEVMEALDIVVVEGECPGSSYYAAELRMPVEAANEVAEVHGWAIRFVAEGRGGAA